MTRIHKEIITNELSEYKSVIIARLKLHNGSNNTHCVYKLTKYNDVYFWAAMWNTCAHTMGDFKSIDGAVKAAIERGYDVKQTTFNEMLPANPMDIDLGAKRG